jgi:hypothetical protein
MAGLLDTTFCDKVCQLLTAGLWFSPDTLVSSSNKNERHVITEILLKVALNIITPQKNLTPISQLAFSETKKMLTI